MRRASIVLLLGFLSMTTPLASQQSGERTSEGLRKAREMQQQMDKAMKESQAKPAAPRPDWQKARADADRLLDLSQRIRSQVQAGPDQVPSDLATELKEVRKLADRIRRELLL